jgi:hypothetical protein
MHFDPFTSYTRGDNQRGRIKQLVERVQADLATFDGRPLV